MHSYVALLRGIGPGNPNMRNDKLRGVFEELGFTNVQTVISSGNVLFSSDETDTAKLESMLEAAWPEKLGFTSTTIIRSQAQIQELVAASPYGDTPHSRESYQLVTFFKHPQAVSFALPHVVEDKSTTLLAATKTELFSTTNTTTAKTPDFMTWLEKHYSKQITSRTYKTLQNISKKLQAIK